MGKDHVAVRLDADTFARIETVREKMSAEMKDLGIILTQSDAVRASIVAGLRALEAKYGIPVGEASIGRPPDGRRKPPAKPPRKR